LQRTKQRMLRWVEHDGSADPERARMARTLGGLRHPDEGRQQKQGNKCAAYSHLGATFLVPR
jgi:hypothetical protein